MRITMDTPVDMLMHGGDIRYVDLDEGELCHWKYIKREKLPNGKWRYYYDYGQYEKAYMEKAVRDYEYAKEDQEAAREAYYWNVDRFLDALRAGNKEERDKYYQYSKNAFNYSQKLTNRRLAKYETYKYAVAKYEQTPLYKMTEAKSKIKNGAKAVSNFFSGLFKKKK